MNTTIWISTKEENYSIWECQNCKVAWQFEYDGPEENELNYCPKCGMKITEFIREGE